MWAAVVCRAALARDGSGAVEGTMAELDEEVSTARLRLPGDRARSGLSGLDVRSTPSSRVCLLRCTSSACLAIAGEGAGDGAGAGSEGAASATRVRLGVSRATGGSDGSSWKEEEVEKDVG